MNGRKKPREQQETDERMEIDVIFSELDEDCVHSDVSEDLGLEPSEE